MIFSPLLLSLSCFVGNEVPREIPEILISKKCSFCLSKKLTKIQKAKVLKKNLIIHTKYNSQTLEFSNEKVSFKKKNNISFKTFPLPYPRGPPSHS